MLDAGDSASCPGASSERSPTDAIAAAVRAHGRDLEKSKVAERLDSFSLVFGRLPGGLGLSVTFVGMLMAASTGIVGATVVTMGLMSLPTMLRHGYDTRLATGTIAATGTLGQIIPPSIALVLLGDVLSSAYQQAQLNMGIFSPDTVSVGTSRGRSFRASCSWHVHAVLGSVALAPRPRSQRAFEKIGAAR